MNKKIVNTASPKKNVSSNSKQNSDVHIIQYVLPLGNGWVIKTSTSAKFTAITDSKKEAIEIGRTLAQTTHTDFIVHGKNGNIEISESYT